MSDDDLAGVAKLDDELDAIFASDRRMGHADRERRRIAESDTDVPLLD